MIFYPSIHQNVYATGGITCTAKANLIDGETVTISDGTTAYIFEFDVNGTGVGGGNVQVNVSTDTTAIQVAARLNTAINGTAITVTSTAVGDGTLTLANDAYGSVGNVLITETVFDPNFLVTGMSGGDSGEGKQSDVMVLGGPGSPFEAPIAIYMPAVWTAADLSFLASFDGVTYGKLEYEGTEVKITLPGAGDVQALDHFKFKAVRYLKLRSGVAAAEVEQTATRTFTLVSAPVAW
jgi:hypothetical protein